MPYVSSCRGGLPGGVRAPVRTLSPDPNGGPCGRRMVRDSGAMGDDEPMWQPLSALPMLTTHAVEGVRLAREHLDTLRQAGRYRLDDESVDHVIRTFSVTRDDLDQLFAGQRRGWMAATKGGRRSWPAASELSSQGVEMKALVDGIRDHDWQRARQGGVAAE